MLEKIRKRLKYLLTAAIVLVPCIVTTRIVIVVRYIEDPQTLFFQRDTVVPQVFNGAVYVISLLFFLSGLWLNLRFSPRRPRLKRNVSAFRALEPGHLPVPELEESPAPSLPKGLLAHVARKPSMPSLTAGTRLFFDNQASSTVFSTMLTGLLFIVAAFFSGVGMMMEGSFSFLSALVFFTALLSGVYFLLASARISYPYARAFGLFSLMPTLWCVLRLVTDFLDLSQNANEYSHVLQIACLLFLTLFFFQEGKFTLPDPGVYRFGFCVGAALAALIVISAVSVPNLLLASFWMVDFNPGVFYSLLEFIIGIYIVAKLFGVIRKLDHLQEQD